MLEWQPLSVEYEIKRKTNLKPGTGCPCAGQSKFNVVSFFLDTIRPFVLELNFGSEPPMGS